MEEAHNWLFRVKDSDGHEGYLPSRFFIGTYDQTARRAEKVIEKWEKKTGKQIMYLALEWYKLLDSPCVLWDRKD